uniref:Putative RdRp n=1 Tax=Leucocoprinus gammaflexivirus C TaxID=2592759 RepID=A0A7G3KGD4_9VIRU|nr:putative RdRp [Leucocoprinus gammaflexivirus C]
MKERLQKADFPLHLVNEWWSIEMVLEAVNHPVALYGTYPKQLFVNVLSKHSNFKVDSLHGIYFTGQHYDAVTNFSRGGFHIHDKLPEALLDPDGACLLHAFSKAHSVPITTTWACLTSYLGADAHVYANNPYPLPHTAIRYLSNELNVCTMVHTPNRNIPVGLGKVGHIFYTQGHYSHQPILEQPISQKSPPPSPSGTLAHLSLDQKLLAANRYYSGMYHVNKQRAGYLAKAIKGHYLGTFLKQQIVWQNTLKTLSDDPPPNLLRTIPTVGRLGISGSGKTFKITTILADHILKFPQSEDFTIVVGTEKLRSELTNAINNPSGKGYRVKTWERALVEPLNPILILDDVSLLPSSLDAMLLLNPNVQQIVFTGDPAQNFFLPPSNCPDREKMLNPITLLKPFACEYLTSTHRLCPNIAKVLGFRTTSSEKGEISTTRIGSGPIIVGTPGMVETASIGGRLAYTPVTCQGSTFHQDYSVQLDNTMINHTDHSIYTALTRGKHGVHITHSNDNPTKLSRANSSIIRALVKYMTSGDSTGISSATQQHIIRSTPRQLSDPLRKPGKEPPPLDSLLHFSHPGGKVYSPDHPGQNILNRLINAAHSHITSLLNYCWKPIKLTYSTLKMAVALSQVPDLHYHINSTVYPEVPDDMITQPSSNQLYFNPGDEQLPASEFPFHPAELLTDPTLIDDAAFYLLPNPRLLNREIIYGELETQQIDTTNYGTSIFLHHRRSDKATEAWTFNSRHVPATRPPIHYLGGGYALFEAFIRTYGVEFPPFDYSMFMNSEMETLGAMLDKGTIALIKASGKNDPSLDVDKVGAFLKGQFISKLGTIYRDAKKGQMITECCQYLNRLFGPMIRYIYNCISSNTGPEILILKSKTDEEVEEWFQTHWKWSLSDPFANPTTNLEEAKSWGFSTYEDDYTGFDSTQNEDFLAFQVLIMRSLQLPEYLIESFVWHHTHLFSFLGEMGVMIPSGAMHTYDFNTLDSMAFFALKHRLTPHLPLSQRLSPTTTASSHYLDHLHPSTSNSGFTTSIALAFSGDDTLANELVSVHPGFSRLPHAFRLQSTGAYTTVPHFVGKLHTPGGSFSDPTLLTGKILYKLSKDNLKTCVLAYASHCYTLHRNYQTVAPYLTHHEKVCHSFNLRILRRALRLYKLPLFGSFFVKTIAFCYRLL